MAQGTAFWSFCTQKPREEGEYAEKWRSNDENRGIRG